MLLCYNTVFTNCVVTLPGQNRNYETMYQRYFRPRTFRSSLSSLPSQSTPPACVYACGLFGDRKFV